MRYTFPALITSSIKLCRRYKNREHLVRTTSPTRADALTHTHRKTTGTPK